MSARFEPPFIQDNPTGWGPNTIPAQFKDMVSDLFSRNIIIIKHAPTGHGSDSSSLQLLF